MSIKKSKRLIIVIGIILIILILLLVVLKVFNKQNNQLSENDIQKISEEADKKEKDAILERLYKMSEQERINYYCAEFFKLIDTKKYEQAYNLLYDEYKENYFPSLASFKRYVQEYFPDDIALNFTNIERLGEIYVLWVDVKDSLNGVKFGHNFSMNVVVKENDYNDYVLSFSRNSAVEEQEAEGDE